MTTQQNPAATTRRQIGADLGKLRHGAHRTVREAADYLDCSPDTVERAESGQAVLRVAELRALLDLYGITGDRRRAAVEAVREVNRGTWWHSFSDLVNTAFERQLILEDEAEHIRVHQPNLVPGLLQTERYAWELMTTVVDQPLEIVRRRVDLRIQRQQILARPGAPALEVILDEAALRRRVGGPDVMREQCERFLRASAESNVSIRIVPFEAGPSRDSGEGFHVFSPRGGDPAVVQLELLDREYYAEAAEEVERYGAAFEHAAALALSVEGSREFITALMGRS